MKLPSLPPSKSTFSLQQVLLYLIFLFICTKTYSSMIAGVMVERPISELFPHQSIRMELAFDQEFTQQKSEASSFDICIYSKFTNISDQPVQLLLKDHDSYHGTLDYPWGIAVRITNSQGVFLTKNSVDHNSWWTSSFLSSQISQLMPGDVITLQKDESVVRKIPLGKILSGIGTKDPALWKKGAFVIEVRLETITNRKALLLTIK